MITYELSPPFGPRLCSLYRLNVVDTVPVSLEEPYIRARPLRNSSCDRRPILESGDGEAGLGQQATRSKPETSYTLTITFSVDRCHVPRVAYHLCSS
jgi:hypothetical protein